MAKLVAKDRNENGHAVFRLPNGFESYRMPQRVKQVKFAHAGAIGSLFWGAQLGRLKFRGNHALSEVI